MRENYSQHIYGPISDYQSSTCEEVSRDKFYFKNNVCSLLVIGYQQFLMTESCPVRSRCCSVALEFCCRCICSNRMTNVCSLLFVTDPLLSHINSLLPSHTLQCKAVGDASALCETGYRRNQFITCCWAHDPVQGHDPWSVSRSAQIGLTILYLMARMLDWPEAGEITIKLVQ